ncbi:MAG: hypothetical protein ACRDTD_20380, partial [Pseudonocardiaceae bacterium]
MLRRCAARLELPPEAIAAEYRELREMASDRDRALTQAERHAFGEAVPDPRAAYALRQLELRVPLPHPRDSTRCVGCGGTLSVGHACGVDLFRQPTSIADWAIRRRENPGIVVQAPDPTSVTELLQSATRPVHIPVAAQLITRTDRVIVSGDYAVGLSRSGGVVLRPSAVSCNCGDHSGYFCRHIRLVNDRVRIPIAELVAERNREIGTRAAAIRARQSARPPAAVRAREPGTPPIEALSYLENPDAFTADAEACWASMRAGNGAIPARLHDLRELPDRTVGHEIEVELINDPDDPDCTEYFDGKFAQAASDSCVDRLLWALYEAGYLRNPVLE